MWSLEEHKLVYRQTLERQAEQYRLEQEALAARHDREAAPGPRTWLLGWLRLSRLVPQGRGLAAQIERKNSMETC